MGNVELCLKLCKEWDISLAALSGEPRLQYYNACPYLLISAMIISGDEVRPKARVEIKWSS